MRTPIWISALLVLGLTACQARRVSLTNTSESNYNNVCDGTALSGSLSRSGSGTVEAGKEVTWQIQAKGGCAVRYRVLSGTTLLLEFNANSSGSAYAYYTRSSGYAAGTQTESVDLVAVDKNGASGSRITVKSSSFTVSPASDGLKCTASATPSTFSVPLNPDGTLAQRPTAPIVINSFDGTTPIAATITSIKGAWNGQAPVNVTVPPHSASTSLAVPITIVYPGSHAFTFTIQDSTQRTANCTQVIQVEGQEQAISARSSLLVMAPNGLPTPGPLKVAAGTQVILSWQTQGVSACSIVPITGSQTLPPQGSLLTPPLSDSTMFLLSCAGSGGQTTSVVQVSVTKVDLKINGSDAAQTVNYEAPLTLTWSVSNAGNCVLNPGNLPAVGTSGTMTIPARVSGAYSLSCMDGGVATVDSIAMTVGNPQDHLMFVTSATYRGADIGGYSGGDDKCKSAAVAAGIRPDRNWMALLSTSSSGASSRIYLFGDVLRAVSRERITTSTGFWASGSSWERAPSYNELGDAITGDGSFWTGTKEHGQPAGLTCGDWTSFSGSGNKGYATDPRTNQRIYDASNPSRSCDSYLRLFCISQ